MSLPVTVEVGVRTRIDRFGFRHSSYSRCEAATIPTTLRFAARELRACMYVFILIAVEPLVRPRPTLQDQSGWVTTSE